MGYVKKATPKQIIWNNTHVSSKVKTQYFF